MESAAGVMVSSGVEVQRTSSSNLRDLLRIDVERANSAVLLDFLRIKQEGCFRNDVAGVGGGGGTRSRQTLGDVLTLTKTSVSNQMSLLDAIRDDPSSSGGGGGGGGGDGGVIVGGLGDSGSDGGVVVSGHGDSGIDGGVVVGGRGDSGNDGGVVVGGCGDSGSDGGVVVGGRCDSGGVVVGGTSGGVVGGTSGGVVGGSSGGVVGGGSDGGVSGDVGGGGGVGSTREIKKNWRQLRKKMKLGRGLMAIRAPDVPVNRNSLSELLQRNASMVLDRGSLNLYNAVGNVEAGAASGEGPGESSGAVVEPARMSLMALLGEGDSAYIINEMDEDDEVEEEGEEEVGKLLDYNACCVCMVRHKGAAFIPCGHTFCRLCSRELYVQRGNCPLCNNLILEILDIF